MGSKATVISDAEWGCPAATAMLATIGGTLALLAGLAVLLLPLLVPELSRPRDAFWGAVVLLLGLVLVTSAERLSGAPMLAVLCGGLLIGRLSTEVSQSRWRQLSKEERQSFLSPARWHTSLNQLATSLIALGNLLLSRATALGGWLKQRTATVNASVTAGAATGAATPKKPKITKRWVRPEPAGAEPPTASSPAAAPLAVVSDFTEVDARVRAALAADQAPPAPAETAGATVAPDPAAIAVESPTPESPAAGAPEPTTEPEPEAVPASAHDPEHTPAQDATLSPPPAPDAEPPSQAA